MKSCPVVLAMRAMSPERPSRTSMPSATSPARMRSRAGLRSSTDAIGLRAIAPRLPGFRERGDQMIEPVAGALELGGEIAAVDGIDRRVEREPPDHVDARAGNAGALPRIVGEQGPVGAAGHREHGVGDAVVALVVVEAERGVGVDGVEPLLLELIGAHLVDETDPAPFLVEVENHAAAGLVEPRHSELELIAAVAAARAEHVAGEAGGGQPPPHGGG